MWHAEKASGNFKRAIKCESLQIMTCLNCRLSVHKNCYSKVASACSKAMTLAMAQRSFFGADLAMLVGDDADVPGALASLLACIEGRALFVEGIYRLALVLFAASLMHKRGEYFFCFSRKNGSLVAVKKVRQEIEQAKGKFRCPTCRSTTTFAQISTRSPSTRSRLTFSPRSSRHFFARLVRRSSPRLINCVHEKAEPEKKNNAHSIHTIFI